MLKGEHYDTLVKEDNPLVEGEKVTEWLEKVTEVRKQSKKTTDNDKIENESEKDKFIKNLRSELKNKDIRLTHIERLYKGCEQEIHILQGEKEKLKIMIKDRDNMLRVGKLVDPELPKENEHDTTSEIETDD